jgi:hypothetical protein
MSNTTAKTTVFPTKVVDILGAEAANEFEQWIEQKLQVTVQHAQPGEIPASIARQKVNVLVLERVGNMLLADDPYLVELSPQRRVWRVPVDLTHTNYGRVGRVAEIDVDAQYGMVDYTDALLIDMKTKAQQIARSLRERSTPTA